MSKETGKIKKEPKTPKKAKEPNKVLQKIKSFLKKFLGFFKGHKLLSIILMILVIGGCIFGKIYFGKKGQAKAEEVGTLTTAVEVMDLQSSVSVTGTLAAGQSQLVTSTVATGTEVAAVYYEVGDYVEAGTVIVEFDADDYATKLAELNAKYNISDLQNEHSLQDYLDQIEDKQEEIADIQEEMDEVQEYLDTWANVYNNLVDAYESWQNAGGSTSSDGYNRWATESSAAKSLDEGNGVSISGYEAKQDSLEDLEDQIADKEEEITELQYQYELAQLQQDYDNTYTKSDEYDQVTESQSGTQVVAPFSGYITAINVEEGNNYTQGNTVFTISNTDSFVVEATVDEYDIASLSEGLSAVVKFDATDDEEFTGTVTYVAVTSDSSSSSSSTAGSTSSSSSASYEVKITLDDTDDRLRVGMTAKASVVLESVTDAYAVAYDCVETDKNGNSYVTAVDDEGNETKITVTLGLESDYYVQIISDELSEGMLVKATAASTTSNSDSEQQGGMMMNMGGSQGGGDMGGGGAPAGGGGAPGGM